MLSNSLEWNTSFGFHALGLCNGALRISQFSGIAYRNFPADVLSVWDLNNFDEDGGGGGNGFGKVSLAHKRCQEKSLFVNPSMSSK